MRPARRESCIIPVPGVGEAGRSNANDIYVFTGHTNQDVTVTVDRLSPVDGHLISKTRRAIRKRNVQPLKYQYRGFSRRCEQDGAPRGARGVALARGEGPAHGV